MRTTKPDLCEWWNDKRIAEEEAIWQRDQYFKRYAGYIRDLAKKESEIKTVIEIGCGMGHVGNELRDTKLDYYGADGSELMISKAQAMYPDLRFGVLNIRMIGNGKKYDCVCSFAVMKHFGVKEFKEMLKKVLSLGKYAVVQLQMRINGAPSVEDDFFGVDVAHSWMAEAEILEAYAEADHTILNPYIEESIDTTSYIADSREVVIISKRKDTEPVTLKVDTKIHVEDAPLENVYEIPAEVPQTEEQPKPKKTRSPRLPKKVK